MNGMSTQSIVEQMTSELAERRRATLGRRAAYLAMAKVILPSDERGDRLVLPQVQGTPRGDWESATAA
jgi:hypothetical protein